MLNHIFFNSNSMFSFVILLSFYLHQCADAFSFCTIPPVASCVFMKKETISYTLISLFSQLVQKSASSTHDISTLCSIFTLHFDVITTTNFFLSNFLKIIHETSLHATPEKKYPILFLLTYHFPLLAYPH